MVIDAAKLRALIATIFANAGCAQDEAKQVALRLVSANLSGHDSHGVVRVPRYLEWLGKGILNAGQSLKVIDDSGHWVLADGNYGFGQVIGQEAVMLGIARAKQHGTAIVALRHSGHLGRIGDWAELACEHGLVSVHFVNVASSALVAPFGARERRMSTAPLSVGVPNEKGDDFILDFATSRVAEGKVLVAFKGGKAIPEDSLVDGDGQSSGNPNVLYGEVKPGDVPNPRLGPGALQSMGEHKGSGLAMACELLAGALTGSGNNGVPQPEKVCNGMLSIYITPKVFEQGGGFSNNVADFVDYVRGAEPRDPVSPVLIAGDPERARRAERNANGVPLTEETWENILNAATTVGLQRAEALSIAGLSG